MASTLMTLRAKVRDVLGASEDTETWTNSMLDAGLRDGLQEYSRRGPVSETSFTVASAGYQQDLSSITNLATVTALAWPWYTGARFEDLVIGWRLIGEKIVYLQAYASVGEILRVRYRQWYTVKDLDGAASTTVPVNHEQILVLAAATGALDTRLRQLSENPAAPKEAGLALNSLRNKWLQKINDLIEDAAGRGSNPVWRDVGL